MYFMIKVQSFFFFGFLEFFEFLLVSFFFSDGGFESSVGVVRSVNGQDGVIDKMEGGKANEDNENLPHECVPLENKIQVSPQGFYSRIGIECRDDLGLPAYVRKFVPKTGLMVWE